jgi:uncharacterized protein
MGFISLNTLAYTFAYTLTHFRNPEEFSLGLSRPISTKRPIDLELEYTTQRILINQTEWLETWFVPVKDTAS